MKELTKDVSLIPNQYSYIEDMPALKDVDKSKKGYFYTVIMVGVACDTNPYLTMSEIYRSAKEMGYFDGINFSTVYNSIKVFMRVCGSKKDGPKEFIGELAWDAIHMGTA